MKTPKRIKNRETLIWEPKNGSLEDFQEMGEVLGYKFLVAGFAGRILPVVGAICRDEKELAETLLLFSDDYSCRATRLAA